MTNIEFNNSELQVLVTRMRKLSDDKPMVQRMKPTDFDRYLEKQLQFGPVAVRFAQADGLPLTVDQTVHGRKHP